MNKTARRELIATLEMKLATTLAKISQFPKSEWSEDEAHEADMHFEKLIEFLRSARHFAMLIDIRNREDSTEQVEKIIGNAIDQIQTLSRSRRTPKVT